MSETSSALATLVIVNWNGRAWLARCLAAVFRQPLANMQVVVVDNGSDDGSTEWLRAHYPQVQLIALTRNVGFAAANNIGIRQTAARYIITLNNDTEVEFGALQALLAAAESDARIGSCAARIVFADRPQVIDSAGIHVDALGFAWQRGHGRADEGRFGAACDVFGASAAAALYRREMLDALGLFDEDFGSYYEDVDLAWRARRAGWRCRYVPAARVLHVHSATGSRMPDRKLYWLTRNRWWTVAKNYPTPRLWLMLPLLALADELSLARALAQRRNLVPLQARLDALRGLPRMWRKRARP